MPQKKGASLGVAGVAGVGMASPVAARAVPAVVGLQVVQRGNEVNVSAVSVGDVRVDSADGVHGGNSHRNYRPGVQTANYTDRNRSSRRVCYSLLACSNRKGARKEGSPTRKYRIRYHPHLRYTFEALDHVCGVACW